MADSVPPTGPSAHGDHNFRKALPLLTWALRIFLVITVGYALIIVYSLVQAFHAQDTSAVEAFHSTGLIDPVVKGLAPEFTDVHGRLLADPPADSTQLQNPATLVFAHIVSDDKDPETAEVSWPELEAHIAAATGRMVTDEVFDNSPAQLATIKKNAITLLALHAADVPYIVNNFGFQPIAVLGDDSGAIGNKLDIIVPANSMMTSPAMLKGHKLTCTVPSSITGYRAAIALLVQNPGLQPNTDYEITWSLKQKASIKGIASGEYEAAAVSDDSLQADIKNGVIDKSAFKPIYQSDVIPRTTIGYFYNLDPDLAAKLTATITSFVPGAADTVDSGLPPLRFIPVDYKKDFMLVRDIDDRFDPRFDAKSKASKAAADAVTPAAVPATMPTATTMPAQNP